ncbi:Broad-complex core protein isoform 6 [Papilio xuthus]|uniref:Broad-complex core protein isoform 6 n=1 Tax=Papilio xuthus TaxID=66420 RepID=A0A194PS33_PAPXU|nr:Broad-complex core protein isoform 6 [Papilio xuthus]
MGPVGASQWCWDLWPRRGGRLTNALMLVVMCGAVGPLGPGHRCEVCGKLLSTRLTLKRHTEQQHLQPLHSARCSLCHKVFRTLNSLNNHKSIYHRRQRALPALPALPAQTQPQNLTTQDPKLAHNIDFYKFKDHFNV